MKACYSPACGRNPQLPEHHQATSSSGNPILPGRPQWITPDTCLNHINPDGQREDASFTHSQRQTTSEIQVKTYCFSQWQALGWIDFIKSGVFHLYTQCVRPFLLGKIRHSADQRFFFFFPEGGKHFLMQTAGSGKLGEISLQSCVQRCV